MKLSERDLRAILTRAREIAATADPETFEATILGILLLLAQQEPEPFADRGLTKRERELLVRATRGETNAEIAASVFISERTVAKHLEHAYAKLGVHGRRQAAQLLNH